MNVTFFYQQKEPRLEPRSLRLSERLGEVTACELELFCEAPLSLDELSDLLGGSATVQLDSALGTRSIAGVVTRVAATASADSGGGRRYRLRLESSAARLRLRRRSRIFQHLSAVAIVSRVLEEGGAGPAKLELGDSCAPRRYVTQYAESDLSFIRRLCEEEGMFFRFETSEQGGELSDQLVLGDKPSLGPAPLSEALPLTEEAGLGADVVRAWAPELCREHATGAVELCEYDFHKPAVAVAASVEAGLSSERRAQLYRPRGLAVAVSLDAAEAERRAEVALQALRAEATTVRFETSAFVLAPGCRFGLEPQPDLESSARPEGEHLVIAVEHRWEHGAAYSCQVACVPIDVRYRLPQRTPRPKVSGVQSAIVTGPAGEEIFVDEDGCVRVRMLWDREGPGDDGSSLPVRVMQPNLAGSMLIPRIGWEVWVAFDGGDPDRPFILGRAFNGKHRPPVALPVNKTMTSLSTSSSPGAGAQNFVRFEDAAGRQGLSFNAGLGMVRNIANNATTQTVGDEAATIDGSQSISIGASQDEAVMVNRVVEAASQTISVGANQELRTPEAHYTKTGAEVVSCAVLMEQVGSPGGALGDLIQQGIMTVGGMIPGAGAVLGVAKTAVEAYKAGQKGGAGAAAVEIGKGVLNFVPGGDLVGDALDVVEGGGHAPWQDKQAKKNEPSGGQQQDSQVGGAPAASDGGAQAGGGGNRVHDISGAMVEVIGGAYAVTTGGQSKWTTLGSSTVLVGGPHATTAGKVSWLVGGASMHQTGAYCITASSIARKTRALQTSIGGPYVASASGAFEIAAGGALSLNAGAITITGKLVLDADGTQVVIDGSGLTVKGATVEFIDAVDCDTAHRI